ncbi:DUF2254 domain-containing protein [Zobellia alginiliquefaciens]|uniref:DUF2254 domain-containing protein n=1 Tax=Zobellia alginiliquefaciens TaxID=3032586 RepID=UPI0023E1F179|nr:DUF2254 family protein [Zobellia alginiliquefaciens]
MLALVKRIYNSISFVTVLIAIGYALIAFVLILFPTDILKDFPSIAITDKDSIKFILSFTIGGIFTLTVFSYTMVMNVLNRSISNYSPRLIPLILHERHHQVILGATSGTIIYSLIMAVQVSSVNIGELSSLAAPLAIVMVVICIFLFIYFIHSVSQSIHVNYVVHRSYLNTKKSIQNILDMKEGLSLSDNSEEKWADTIAFDSCGYLNYIRMEKLISLSEKHGVQFKLEKQMGTFVQIDEVVLSSSSPMDKKLRDEVKRCLSVDRSEPVDVIEIGFKHLVEVAIKGSSPAINDPGTSLIAIDYLMQLFILRKKIPTFNSYHSKEGGCVFFELVPKDTLKAYVFREMEHYMKEDPILSEKLRSARKMLDS